MIIANAQLGAGYKFQMLFRLPVCMKNGFHPRESVFFRLASAVSGVTCV